MSGIPIHQEPMILNHIHDLPHLYNITSQQLRKRNPHSLPPTPNEIMRVINRVRKSRKLPKLYLDTDPQEIDNMFGFAGYQDVLTDKKPPPLNPEFVTQNMDSISLQFWINAKVANGSTLYKLIKQINRIRNEKGWKPDFLTNIGYDSIQIANTDDPSLNYTTNPERGIETKEENEHIHRKHTRKALKDLQKMSDLVDIGVLDKRFSGNTNKHNIFDKYLRKNPSRNSKSSISEQSSDFSSENSTNSSSSRKTKKARI